MSEFQLGKHEQAIELLLQGQERVEASVAAINKTLAEMRGERRATLWWLSTGGAVMGSALTLAIGRLFR